MPAAIRPATLADLPGALDLLRQLNPDDPDLPASTARAAWQAMLGTQGLTVLVAEQAGALVGTCTLVVVPNLSRGARPYGVIENVVTDAAHRGQGIGHAVLGDAVQRAWAAGCYKVMLMTGSTKPSTLQFYESAGFEQSKTGFQIRRHPPRRE